MTSRSVLPKNIVDLHNCSKKELILQSRSFDSSNNMANEFKSTGIYQPTIHHDFWTQNSFR